MNPAISVVICVYNGADTLARALQAVLGQSLPRQEYEIIVVDDGSTDESAKVAGQFAVRLLREPHRGLAAARNCGWQAAQGEWVAFTDDDCAPTRHWLRYLHGAVQAAPLATPVLGAAGRIVGFPTEIPAARYVELRGGFNTERHLAHPHFPYAPMGNILYRRTALAQVGGLDARYDTYEACDLHLRLLRAGGGAFFYEPRAVVFHQHYTTWRAYYRQQRGYGHGLAQFMWHYRAEAPWSLWRELRAWAQIGALGGQVLLPADAETALLRRGDFVKALGLRLGFAATYWRRQERRRW